jgi:hypothetical protein
MDTTRTGASGRPRAGALIALALAGATALGGLPGPAAAGAPPLRTVLVTGTGDAAAAVRTVGGLVLDHLPLIGGVSARLPRGAHLPGSWTVVPDRPVGISGESSAGNGPASTVRRTLGLGRVPGSPSRSSTPAWRTSPTSLGGSVTST